MPLGASAAVVNQVISQESLSRHALKIPAPKKYPNFDRSSALDRYHIYAILSFR